MRLLLTIALGAFLLLATFAEEAFAQRRGGGVSRGHVGRAAVGARYVGRGYVGRGYVGRGYAGRAVVGAGYLGRGIAYRGYGYRRYGYRPLVRGVELGLVGAGAGYGYYSGYYDTDYGDSCIEPRLVWNGWAYQRAWVRVC